MKFINSITNSTHNFGWGPIVIHWLVALSIIGLYPLGLYIVDLTYYDPEYRTVPHWHKSIGLLLALIMMVRLGWRLVNKPPKPLPQPKFLSYLTQIIHSLLYCFIITVLISGYLISTADGRAIAVFNWFEIPAIPSLLENQEDIAGLVHFYSATSLVSFSALHALAALKHHFINKDDTLNRMLGRKKANA